MGTDSPQTVVEAITGNIYGSVLLLLSLSLLCVVGLTSHHTVCFLLAHKSQLYFKILCCLQMHIVIITN